jgi:hypothetical protein
LETTAPVVGSSSTGFGFFGPWKSNIFSTEPARASNELSPIRPVPQLSSMNLRIED